MSETHTPGLIHAGELDGDHVFLWDTDQAHLIADVVTDDVPATVAVANAARLAACWNFCEGIPTTDLMPGCVADMRRQRDELRAAMATIHAKTTAVLYTAALQGAGSDSGTLAKALASIGDIALSRCT